MAKRAFDVGYRRLEWFCHKEDFESISVAKRIGFKYEGVYRNYGVAKGF
jgi:RimJ/RimL family protein N-acetyltransferase